jgi:N-methylhydantoinase A/oxoprolinase/acetone carboxylase beta subunit
MMDDLEVESPSDVLTVQELQVISKRYDDLFDEIFKRGTKSPELGYHITKAIATGVVPVPKPRLPEHQESDKKPFDNASKGSRKIYWERDWHMANLWEMSILKSGNVINGPAVIEAPATTLLVPPNFRVRLDKHRIFHMEVKKDD